MAPPLLIAIPAFVVALLPVYIAFRRGCPSRWAVAFAVAVSLALLPVSIMSGGVDSVARYGRDLLLLWWTPALTIWLIALFCACLEPRVRRRGGFEVLPASPPPQRQPEHGERD